MRNLVLCCSVATALFALLATGCDDDCEIGESQCVSSSLIRSCVPTEDGNEWLVHQCGISERCERGASSDRDAGADPDGGNLERSNASAAACVGVCETGDHSCVSPRLARICIHGGSWQLDACDVGETCAAEAGACVIGSGENTVQRCMPGARACASDQVEKVCDADGSAWVQQPCAANQSCQNDRCAADPKSSCDDANTCLDNKTALRCLGGDRGFELVKCEGELYCEAGRCRGAVCAIGSMCTTGDQIRECADGVSFKDSQCGAHEICQQLKDKALCVPKQCAPGMSACGDPRDANVDPKKTFTTCIVAAGGSGVPEWVKGECTGNTTCNPALVTTANPCSQECTKGAQRCANDPTTGVNGGFQECGDDGTWGPAKTCNTDGQSEKQCVQVPSPNASMLPKAVCADPICGWVFNNPSSGAQGVCDADQLRSCRPDGTLGDPSTCRVGSCRNINMVTTADGRTPGVCDAMMQCEAGEELCLSSMGELTPRYRSCVNGVFGTEVKTCDNDGACYDTRDAAGKRRKICGAACAPGTARCMGGSQVERCDAEGRWGGGEQCQIGECRELASNDASCVLECVPGSVSCEGTTVTAPDGFHSGRSQQRTCESDGTWGSATNCSDNRVCRVTKSLISIGCVACVGPRAPGGNTEGSVDSRCDPGDQAKIQDCGDNNNWLSSRTCSDDKACVTPVAQTCGACMGAGGDMFACTDSNLRTEQICSSCQVPLTAAGPTTIPVCTQTAIAATPNTATTVCAGVPSGSAPSSWAGEADCCGGYQRTALQASNASCTGLNYGAPTMWGGVQDCCSNYREGTEGAAFAYCD